MHLSFFSKFLNLYFSDLKFLIDYNYQFLYILLIFLIRCTNILFFCLLFNLLLLSIRIWLVLLIFYMILIILSFLISWNIVF